MSGRGAATRSQSPPKPPLPPLHAEAYDAIEAGDYPRAIAAYEKALAENPRDADARAGLGQVRLLDRVQGADLQAARAAAAAGPTDIAAQLPVADLDLAGGHVDDAFARLLDLFAAAARPTSARRCASACSSCSRWSATPTRASLRARGRLASLLF